MNILFVTSAASKVSPFFMLEKRPPLGLGTLISIVRNHGHKVFFIDNFLDPSGFIEDGFIQKNKIDFVAVSVNTVCYRESLKMLKKIDKLRREKLSKVKIIVGGPHTSVAPDSIPGFVDYIVQGEGEEVILDIINGNVKERMIKKPRLKDLDSLPFQPWDILSKLAYNYQAPFFGKDTKPVFTMNTSRGCPLNCAFCSVASIWGKEYTFFSAQRIISEIEYLIKNYDAKGVFFREDNFTLNTARTREFCDGLIRQKIEIPWMCESRADDLCDEDLVKLMSSAGCAAVYLGIESGSQRILDALHKGITIEQIKKAIGLCKKYDIKTYCSLMVGLPNETYEDFLLTRRLMEDLSPDIYRFSVFAGVPGSPLYNSLREDRSYEHIDDLGILYLPGYDVKARFFYRINSGSLVKYRFRQRTDYDKCLLRELRLERIDKIVNCADRIMPFLPLFLAKAITKIKLTLKNILFRIFI
ncbi:MAG: radical SAM protein [Candidatus Omnitrophica bacterium]|nr:radical SAM protein [Candidatus Omnitrophota bacterium]HOX54392.1 radical SAM protein [Candidatus Omnitrophota bacterium]